MKRDSVRRWSVLVLAALVMMAGYVFWDIVSPLSTSLKAPLAEGGFGWTSAEYGFYAGSYSIFNIFFLMLFFGGIILDKCGIRFTGLLATGAMLVGAMINYYAITSISPLTMLHMPFTLFGMVPSPLKTQVLIAAIGFGLFGVGCDITGITVSKVITKWFTGHELASAMGLQVALARLGTASALSFSPLIAQAFGLSAPILAGAIVLLIGFVLFIIYCPIDRQFDQAARSTSKPASQQSNKPANNFSFHDFMSVLKNPGFWFIAILCLCFYGSIRPFMKFASDLMVNKYGVAETTAGWIVAAIPYGTIVLTPLFGSLYDRIGHGIRLMLIGCLTLAACHFCLMMPFIHEVWFAIVVMVCVGVAFSLVPSALWPCVPKIVPLAQLGTAYSIIYYIQNLGLMFIPWLVGDIIGQHTAADGTIDFTVPMLIFLALAVAACVMALLLLFIDRKKGFGLEKANITQS